jgi:hypothetical protein
MPGRRLLIDPVGVGGPGSARGAGGIAGRSYEHLPIYKQAMDVAVHFERAVAGFSRYCKYTLGTELRNHSREIVGLIVRANSVEDKRPCEPTRTVCHGVRGKALALISGEKG